MGRERSLHFPYANLSHNNVRIHADLLKCTIYLSMSTQSSMIDNYFSSMQNYPMKLIGPKSG